MRLAIGIAGMAAAMLVAPTGAAAAPFQYDCRATLGEDPNLWVEQAGPNYRVRGTLEVARVVRWPYPPGPLMMDGNNIPPTGRGASVSIGSRASANYVILGISAEPGAVGRVGVGVGFSGEGAPGTDPVGGEWDVMPLTPDELGRVSVPFELTADAEGVTGVVDGRRRRFEVPIGTEGEIRVGCTGGDFLFRGLDWDR
jgi:hypothetical protein